jgi:hypothetical protein
MLPTAFAVDSESFPGCAPGGGKATGNKKKIGYGYDKGCGARILYAP